jgi:hypothetical protein
VTRLWFPHLALWLVGLVVLRVALVPAEDCPPATPAAVMEAAKQAGDWLAVNLDERGMFTYGYDRATDEVSTGYSIVRHAGAAMSLYQLAGATADGAAATAGDHSLQFLIDSALITTDDWSAIGQEGQPASLGATGLTIAAMGLRRDVTGDASRDDLMRAMGRFIVAQQQPNGSILARWDRQTAASVPDQYDVFATGEALWALAILHRMFPDEGWNRPALLTMDYLVDGTRERNEGEIARLPDHWAAYALEEFGKSGLVDDQQLAYARRLAGYFSLRLRVEAQRTGEPVNVAVRGWPGPPAGVGTSGEGMAALYRLALTDARLADIRPDMGARLTCAAGLMAERQVSPGRALEDPRPWLTEGAWFYRSYTQIDDQQHVLSALLGAAGVEEDDR